MHGLIPPYAHPVRKLFLLAADVIEASPAVVLQLVATHKYSDVQSAAQVLYVCLISPVVITIMRNHKLRLKRSAELLEQRPSLRNQQKTLFTNTPCTCIGESNAHGDVTRVAIYGVTECQYAFAVHQAAEAPVCQQALRRPFVSEVAQALVHSTAEKII